MGLSITVRKGVKARVFASSCICNSYLRILGTIQLLSGTVRVVCCCFFQPLSLSHSFRAAAHLPCLVPRLGIPKGQNPKRHPARRKQRPTPCQRGGAQNLCGVWAPCPHCPLLAISRTPRPWPSPSQRPAYGLTWTRKGGNSARN